MATGSIPLPALDVRTPQPNDALGSFQKLMALRSMANQQQIQQQTLQSQQQEQQLRQQQINDQQSVQQYLRQNPTSTFGDAAEALKGKISLPAYTNLIDTDATIRQKHAQATDAELKNVQGAHGQLQTLFENIKNLSPEDLAAQTPQIAQKINSIPGSTVKWNPAQPLTPDALEQFGRMNGLQEGYLSQELAKRKTQAETTEAQQKGEEAAASTEQKRLESQYYQTHGGAPGVAAETVQQNAWLARPENKGKDAADFLAWKAKQSPVAMVMGNMLGKGGEGTVLDQQAEKYFQTGQLPSGFARSPGTTAAILQRASELHPGESLAAGEANFKANQGSLTNLQKNFDQVSAFEQTAGKNLDLFLNKLSAIPDLGVKFANIPLRSIDEHMIGTDNYQMMKAAQQTASAEAAKVLSSANASGVLSDTQKKEAEDMLSGNLSYSAAKGVVATLKQDFGNRHASYQAQIADIQRRLGGQPSGNGGSNQDNTNTNVQQSTGHKVGDVITQNGHQFKATSVDAKGKVLTADPQ